MYDTVLPTGTITFLFSDIEGSTRLWESHPEGMKVALERHDGLLRQAIEENHGQVIKTTGDGFHAAFETAADAVRAALCAQQGLWRDAWSELQPQSIHARVGLHTGEAGARSRDYYGNAVNRAARLMSIGHGGQILLSTTTADLIRDELPENVGLLDLGEHRLRDLVRPEHVYQLTHPELPVEFPALNSIDAFPNNLPVQLTSYIGRERELAELKRMLSATRLLTLIGPGGIGKTRLALQLAADLLSTPTLASSMLEQGVWLVELAPLAQPAQVLGQIASIFDLRETQESPLLEVVTNFLRAKRLLLVLDNCEHVVEECARLSDHLLRACPGLKMIVSSREGLGIAGETMYRVPSLTLPGTDELTPAALMQYEAVQLFVERATAAQPRFMLSERNAPAIARICQRLDGIPLALELAAARIPVFTPEQIAARLDDRFRLLTGGSRTSLPRQQTLRALIDWSYELLSPAEQVLFRRLSVFTGGWTLEAAELVCADDFSISESFSDSTLSSAGHPIESFDVLDLLSRLVNKSLVVVSEQDEEARYSMLETIRQYAREQMLEQDRLNGSSDIHRTRDRHLAYFLNLTQNANEDMIRQGIEWLSKIDAENENLRSAFEWGLEYHPEDALYLIGNLYVYLNIRYYPLEVQRLTREALKRVEALPPPAGNAARLHRLKALAKGYTALGQFLMTLGAMADAVDVLDHSIALARELNDPILLMWGLGFKSVCTVYLDRIEEARVTTQELIALSRAQGERWAIAMGLGMLSWVEGSLGNLDTRETLARQAGSMMDIPENPMMYNTLLMLGLEARIRNDLETARDYLERCLSYTRLIHSRPYEAMVSSELAHVDRLTGNTVKALESYRTTIRLWNDLGHRPAIAHQLECFAFLAKEDGNYPRAVNLLGAAAALRELIDSRMTSYEQVEYQQVLDHLRQALSASEFNQYWTHGQRMTVDEAIACALEQETVSSSPNS